jgi:hypothetical protein
VCHTRKPRKLDGYALRAVLVNRAGSFGAGIMVRQVLQLSVLWTAVLAAGCSSRDENSARVMIDVRCDSNADCPRGFLCEPETEHGPPTTMCESDDPGATCPRDYETHVGYGQVFCIPRLGVQAHNLAPVQRSGRARESSAR